MMTKKKVLLSWVNDKDGARAWFNLFGRTGLDRR